MPRTTMSRSVTMPINRSCSATGTAPKSLSRICAAISVSRVSGSTYRTCSVMTSLICISRCSSVGRLVHHLVRRVRVVGREGLLQLLGLLEMSLHGGYQARGQSLGIVVLPGFGFLLQQRDRVLMRIDLALDVSPVEVGSRLHFERLHRRLLRRAEIVGQRHVFLLG